MSWSLCFVTSPYVIAWFGAEIPWRDVREQYPLYQNSTWSEDLLSWRSSFAPCLINVDDCTSSFDILRLQFLNFVLCDFTLLEVASHDIQGYKPLLPWACLMPWSVRVVCAQPFWWNKPSWPLPTCRPLCTLWIALSIYDFAFDLSCFMHWLQLEMLYPFKGNLRSNQTVQDPL